MSELKEHQFCESDEFFREYPGPLSNEMRPYYLKSEADKVIAKLQSKVTLASLADDCSSLRHKRCNYCSELQRQKYKRCLAMAMWCNANVYNIRRKPLCDMDDHEGWQHDDEFWQRWHKRWLALSDKFKEG